MNFQRRLYWVFWGMGLLLTALVGCGGGTNEGVVTFAVFGDPAEYAAYENLVAEFEIAHPEIDIQLQHIPGQRDYRRRLAAAFSAGEPPAVMLLNYRRFANVAAEGGLEPLGPYIEESDILSTDQFFPITIDSFRYEEQLWCVPQNISSLVVYYNRDLFTAAGLEPPADDWTWADFLTTAQTLTRDTDGDGAIDQYGVGLTPNIFRLAPFIWQNGGRLVDDPDNPTRLALDDPASLEAFRWFTALQTEHGVVPTAVDEAAESSESRFLNGRMGMYFNSRRGVPAYRTIDRFTWDVVPLPRREQAAGILHSDAYCMAAVTADKAAAWTFIEYANSAVGQAIVAPSGRTVPSNTAVARSEAFLQPQLPPANAEIYVTTADLLRGVPVMAGWVGVEETASRDIERAFYGQVSVEQAAQDAIERTREYFEE